MPLKKIHVTGIVQGVGFRPFVYQLATRASLNGWVANTSAGVDIEIEGERCALENFVRALQDQKPPLAQIDSLHVQDGDADTGAQFDRFDIRESVTLVDAFQPISPDIAICPDCLRELFDSNDRRYRYPFINCTNCGPRFTIIQDIPYDRPKTTMHTFEMCDDCAREYHDPSNRRFHAQPVACPQCGPKVWLEISGGLPVKHYDPIMQSRALLMQGSILAIKGLGGFHLACDATNAIAVAELRRRKLRVDKPFALMMLDVATVEKHCFVNEHEHALLESHTRPIVLLRRRSSSPIAEQVAPNHSFLGVMLPYTPLHYLLLEHSANPLVMTSGNLSEEPIAVENDEARTRLGNLADYFLFHDRDIHVRCDDSVVRVFGQASYPLRRSRGYTPGSIQLPFDAPPLLAVGAELKNTVCLARERYAFLSHHIGDLENYETLQSFEKGIAHFERLFRVQPQTIAYDLHPNYLASRYALDRAAQQNILAVGVQHHHAHIASCMVEHGLDGTEPVIGVAFDGTGYGDDGTIWGGEFLIADYVGYQRTFHLDYIPLPGGDKATREPWRIALAWLKQAGIEWIGDLLPVRTADLKTRKIIQNQIEHQVNAPLTSSMGRLFDAVAALTGMRQIVNYEAQAAIEFENQCGTLEGSGTGSFYEFRILPSGVIDPVPLIHLVVEDIRTSVSVPVISVRFHNGVAEMVRRVCGLLREREGLNEVVLSGGVWQNMILLARTRSLLQNDGFTVYVHRQVPTNDGGLALGQAAVAVATINHQKS
jgi:hydrogenase maturation protein HypF